MILREKFLTFFEIENLEYMGVIIILMWVTFSWKLSKEDKEKEEEEEEDDGVVEREEL